MQNTHDGGMQAMGLSLPDAYLHGETIARLIPKRCSSAGPRS